MALEVLRCPNCAAPIDPSIVGQVAVCAYCGLSISGLSLRAPPQPSTSVPQRHGFDPGQSATGTTAHGHGLTEATVLSLAKRHLGVGDCRYFSPDIPASKEANARKRHKSSLPETERMLVLFDDTVFGAADDGFVITVKRLCWHNILEDPYMIEWAELDPADVRVDKSEVVVAHGKVQLTQITSDKKDFLSRTVKLFRELASNAQ